MTNKNYELWINYHMNPKGSYTEEELREIRCSEFAMELLLPTDKVLYTCGGIDILKEMNDVEIIRTIKTLKDIFSVEEEVLFIKLKKLINQRKDNKVKMKHLKKF